MIQHRTRICAAHSSTPRHLAALALLLASCAYHPAMVPPARATVDITLGPIAEAEPRERAACEASIPAALRRHGFVLASGGTPVRIGAFLWRRPDYGGPNAAANLGNEPTQDPRPGGAPLRMLTTADFTATLDLSGHPRTVIASGHGDGPSACASGAERLADAMAKVLGAP